MADSTTTVFHPTAVAPNGEFVRYEVPTGDVQKWADQGWLKSEPKSAAAKAAQKAADQTPAEA